MERNMIVCAYAGDIARIAVDFRLYHYDMHTYITLQGILYRIYAGSTRGTLRFRPFYGTLINNSYYLIER